MKRVLDMTPAAVAKREQARKAYAANPDAKIAKVQAYKDANSEVVKAKGAAYMRERRATSKDVQFRLREKQRNLFYSVMQPACKMNAERVRMCQWLGLSVAHFRLYLSGQFAEGWHWGNAGSVWVIDHIKPLVDFDLTDPAQCAAVWHHTNLRPLDRTENQRKSAKERNSK